MTQWSEGYVTEIEYTHGFYSELAPQLLQFALLSRGIAAPRGPISYLELGCGNGVSANIIAAANPEAEVVAVDFNPAHIRQARALAEAAGTPNVRFLERSFQDLAQQEGSADDAPQGFDVIALHGVYSWISAANRGYIRDIIRKRLKPGGIVYISYNAYPGWAAGATLQRLIHDGGVSGGGPVLHQIQRGFALTNRLKELNARFFTANPTAGSQVDALKGAPVAYIAHKYMNADWSAFHFSDVAHALGEAKLAFGASATLAQHADIVNFTEDQRKLIAAIPDGTVRELVRDVILNTSFRRDIFVRGAGTLSQAAQRNLWNAQAFVLLQDPADVPRQVTAQAGQVSLNADIYDPVLAALAKGPQTLAQLREDPAVSAITWEQTGEALQFLMILGAVQLAAPAEGEAERAVRTKAINDALIKRINAGESAVALASPVTGSGVSLDSLSQLFLAAEWGKEADKAGFVLRKLKERGHNLLKDGVAIEDENEVRDYLGKALEAFESKTVKVLQRTGIV